MKKTLRRIVKACLPAAIARQKLSRRAGKSVLLTFDDGPDPEITPRVLDTLERWNAKAVFFVLGSRVAAAPDIIRDVLARGHAVGNHTYTHNFPETFSTYVSELKRCQQMVLETTGQAPRFFRPPRGRLTPTIILAARSLGLPIVHWSMDVGEYSYMRDASAEQLAANLLSRVSGRQIVLMHDDNQKIATALEIALPRLATSGLELSRGVSELG